MPCKGAPRASKAQRIWGPLNFCPGTHTGKLQSQRGSKMELEQRSTESPVILLTLQLLTFLQETPVEIDKEWKGLKFSQADRLGHPF